jgi:hypothetical protein
MPAVSELMEEPRRKRPRYQNSGLINGQFLSKHTVHEHLAFPEDDILEDQTFLAVSDSQVPNLQCRIPSDDHGSLSSIAIAETGMMWGSFMSRTLPNLMRSSRPSAL